MARPTQAEVRAALDYDPATGVFTWRERPASTGWRPSLAGTEAGCIDVQTGYRRMHVCGAKVYAHRLAWFYVHGDWPSRIDHINGRPDDNRIANLRPCTASQNAANMRRPKDNSTGFKGVCFDKWAGRFVASIRIDGKHKNLGRFDTAEEAHEAYIAAAREQYGDFARAA